MKIYLFSQALDNKSEDDWFEAKNQKPIRIHDENTTAIVNNKIFELCSTKEILAENELKIFHSLNPDQSNNAVLIIDLNDKDVNGRRSLTTVFIERFHERDLNIDFSAMLNEFKFVTGRKVKSNNTTIDKLNSTIKLVLKKKAMRKKNSLVLIGVISLLILLMLVIGLK
ncbi:hypothetical protein EXU29_09090 [Acinetobacter wuhouensis]|uniref:hypothetical protein n=1 Tax=Acinetobacter wuhouensis TaxID=1879050 RepID=UPI00102301EF|nr:hypothetical protein [Acinetobacter wuhouensis]RZG72652.1 hypothetical protein EXU29_09090 [Acinetobacter wuhouensis]